MPKKRTRLKDGAGKAPQMRQRENSSFAEKNNAGVHSPGPSPQKTGSEPQ